MALAEIKAQLGGNWKLDRSENFEEALKEMGMNLLIRKLAGAVSSSLEIDVVDDSVKIVAKASLFSRTITFKLNEEYEEEFEGINMKCISTWEDGKLKTTSEPKEAGKVKPQRFVRERVNDELVQAAEDLCEAKGLDCWIEGANPNGDYPRDVYLRVYERHVTRCVRRRF